MQDGAAPSDGTQQTQNQQTDGGLGEPKVIPISDPNQPPPQVSQPQGQQQPQGQASEGNGEPSPEDYWKGEAARMREQAGRFEQFSGLISYLEKNPAVVGQLEQVITGQATQMIAADDLAAQSGNTAPTEEDLLAQELGLSDGNDPANAHQRPPQQQQVQPSQEELVRRAREQGAAEERARVAFGNFTQELVEGGVPDHAVDAFVQFLQNPGALSYRDLFAAYNSHRQAQGQQPIQLPPTRTNQVSDAPQTAAQQVTQAPQGPNPGVPVQSMAGATERPDDHRYQSNEGDVPRSVPNPNEI